MLRVICFISLIVSVSLVPAQDTNKKTPAKKIPKPRFRISKETTHVLGPLTKNGYIDYAAALNAHYGKGVLKHQNAAVLYFSVISDEEEGVKDIANSFYQKLGISVPKKKVCFRELIPLVKSQYQLKGSDDKLSKVIDELYDMQVKTQEKPWKTKEYPEIAMWLKANANQLAVISEASQRRKMFIPRVIPKNKRGASLLDAMAPGVSRLRDFGRAFQLRAMLHLGHGNRENAWDDLMTLQRMARHVGEGPSMIEMLVGIALHRWAVKGQLLFLQHTKLDRMELQKYLHDLRQLQPLPALTKKIDLFERFFFLDTVQNLSKNSGLGDENINLEIIRRKLNALPKKDETTLNWNLFMSMGNKYYDGLGVRLRQSEKEIRGVDAIASLEKWNESYISKEAMQKRVDQAKTAQDKSSSMCGNVILAALFPLIGMAKNAEYRGKLYQRNLVIAFALAAYKNDYKKYPAKLTDLSPKYLDKIPRDIYSGKPLKYKLTKDGYLLYSVGPNGKDDNGNSIYSDDKTGDDIVTRMPYKVK